MPKMTELELKALLDAEKTAALSAPQASRLSSDREQAQRYYLGDMSRDMPALDGRRRHHRRFDADFDGHFLWR